MACGESALIDLSRLNGPPHLLPQGRRPEPKPWFGSFGASSRKTSPPAATENNICISRATFIEYHRHRNKHTPLYILYCYIDGCLCVLNVQGTVLALIMYNIVVDNRRLACRVPAAMWPPLFVVAMFGSALLPRRRASNPLIDALTAWRISGLVHTGSLFSRLVPYAE